MRNVCDVQRGHVHRAGAERRHVLLLGILPPTAEDVPEAHLLGE